MHEFEVREAPNKGGVCKGKLSSVCLEVTRTKKQLNEFR
jgi:hypothetical protein